MVLTSRFPHPLDKGDKLRVFHHIIELSQYTNVTLICLHEDPISEASMAAVSPYCDAIHSFQLSKRRKMLHGIKSFLFGMPLQIGYFINPNVKERINLVIDEFEPDHVHCHMIRMMPYVRFKKGISYSIDYMDSMVLNDMAGQHLRGPALGLIRFLERRRVAAFEEGLQRNFQYHFIISQRDKDNMPAPIRDDIVILSNGVEISKDDDSVPALKIYDICFCGNLGYVPNQKALEIIRNDIRPMLPTLSYVFAGAESPLELITKQEEGLTVLSPVADMSDVYLQSRILLAPIFTGSGQQNKILEAMALGVPCITTTFVNESIDANNGSEILIADDAKGFIEGVKVLLSQPEIYAEISKNGKVLIEKRFDWSRNTKPLIDAILNSNKT